MKNIITLSYLLTFLYLPLKAQTITQEVGKISFIKSQYLNEKNNSEISLAYYKTYLFPDSTKSIYKLIISTQEMKKTEVGNSVGGATYSGGWGLSFNKIYSKEFLEGVCEINAQEIPEFTKLFGSILTTSGEFKVSLSKQKVSSILITESFKNLTFGGELNENGMQYYFKIDKSSYVLSEIEFFQVAKFLSKIVH